MSRVTVSLIFLYFADVDFILFSTGKIPTVFGRSLLSTFVGGADFLYIDRPQALAGHLPVKHAQVFTPWNKTSGLSVTIHFRYPFHKRELKRTWRHHVSGNKCSPAGFMCGMPTICGGIDKGPAITAASAGQHYIIEVIKDTYAVLWPGGCVQFQHRTIMSLYARNFTEDIVFLLA